MNVWVDIDNPPQARYLLPLADALRGRGHDVRLSARDQGDTVEILRAEGATFDVVGSGFGRGIPRKVVGLVRRARQLDAFLRQLGTQPELVITGSRAATLTARRRGIASFVLLDYEHVDLRVYRLARSHVLYPDVIDGSTFERRGIKPERLLPFDGLKEDLSFSRVDIEETPPAVLGNGAGNAPTFLFRPPAEESHYYDRDSRRLALALLRHFAQHDVQVVLSPRYPSQIAYVREVGEWVRPPHVLEHPVPFVSLLKAVDAVISAGGTMLREAAYLGIPAYSIFRSRIGSVDRYLSSLGRLTLLTSPADFARISFERSTSLEPLRTGSQTADAIVAKIENHVAA